MKEERIIVYEPHDGEAGLAVRYDPDPGPHETKFVVEQLWASVGDEDTGRAEPVYVGDETRVASLIEALAGALELDFEVNA